MCVCFFFFLGGGGGVFFVEVVFRPISLEPEITWDFRIQAEFPYLKQTHVFFSSVHDCKFNHECHAISDRFCA